MLRLTVLQALIVGSIAQELCLDDGVPESQREYIQDDAGNNIPIGVFEMNYEPSHLLSNMTALMIREVLGFHAQVDPKMGSGGDTFLWALAGCTDFNDGASRTCGTQETTIHVSVDSWLGGYTLTQNELAAKYPQLAPEDLGSMGYSGQNSIFVSQAVHTAAYSDSGLALDHYRSYNTTQHDPKKYFDSVQDVDLSELAMCSGADMIMNNNNVMRDYLKYSGDAEGVELQADGSYIAKCWNDRWWYAPACRQDASTCIPVFTAGTGWFLQAIMQWSTAYGIPAAIGVSGGWQLWQKHVRTFRALHYGWLPDSTFADMLPQQVVFPPHNAQEWAAGDQKTASESVHIAKMVSSNLKSKAGRVREFVSNIHFEMQEVQSLLFDLSASSDVACKWLRDNPARWSSWTPPKTRCYEGFGLVDASGAFVSNRTSAVGCGLCQAGTASEQLIDAEGTTFQCKPCPPGYKQSDTSSTQCEPCPSGSFASSSGSATCNLCAQGTYQPDTAQTSCIPCSASQSTVLQGATSAADCVDSSTPNPTGSESFSDANKLVVGTLLLWSGLGTHVL